MTPRRPVRELSPVEHNEMLLALLEREEDLEDAREREDREAEYAPREW